MQNIQLAGPESIVQAVQRLMAADAVIDDIIRG